MVYGTLDHDKKVVTDLQIVRNELFEKAKKNLDTGIASKPESDTKGKQEWTESA